MVQAAAASDLAVLRRLLAKRRWNFFPVGRAMGCGVCAVFMVASPLHILRPQYVLDQPGLFDVNTIATLFGLTIATGCLKDHGVITWFMRALKKNCSSPRNLMVSKPHRISQGTPTSCRRAHSSTAVATEFN